MARLLKFLLIARLKQRKTAGFTLIELLVAMIIAVLIMIPLMSLAINLIDTDRKEQAKSTSEQELQAAADFIARDLERAIYVYDAIALTTNNNATPANSGIRDQIPPVKPAPGCTDANLCQPVLAFWTRRLAREAVPAQGSNVNCRTASDANREASCDDTFVYSLVVYYLILNNGADKVWSNTARIGRFELSDGVKGVDGSYLDATTTQGGNIRDPGFVPFDLGLDDSIRLSMNQWESGSKDTNNQITPEAFDANSTVQILVDYIDQTTVTDNANIPRTACPAPVTNPQIPQEGWIQSPYYGTQNPAPSPAPTAPPADFQTYSFYSCINAEEGIVKVFLRGNAYARIQNRNNPGEWVDTVTRRSFFPSTSVEVNAEGVINQ
ncbi:hormogonium polysaccharide secretion pseudopilin HpsC [Spirulina major CS-329]|uniref:hormogonium polysaccharide secretion pseudopilin HpsC n=1 Tax=Spirulina TaxID=1154 RepID=UPI00232FCD8E|nr:MULTISPECIES: hormogonium polysaccharide secretion pseudopilin HpsC [Spirulina]MDB9496615.1 hormogonium polysaccharide secretion pseudopilin HpsC [Spirulina subsalsa CS-330]MDB9502150.1 hormogonium polysaccharide secretion pseudopilin HpsC [Spirulina major CS-329]